MSINLRPRSEYRPPLGCRPLRRAGNLLHVDSHCCEYVLVGRVAQDEGHQDEDRGPAPFGPRPGSLLVVPGFVRFCGVNSCPGG